MEAGANVQRHEESAAGDSRSARVFLPDADGHLTRAAAAHLTPAAAAGGHHDEHEDLSVGTLVEVGFYTFHVSKVKACVLSYWPFNKVLLVIWGFCLKSRKDISVSLHVQMMSFPRW